MMHNPKLDLTVLCGLAFVTLFTAAAVAYFNPGVVSFRPLNAAEFLQLMLPLVMVALFIERVLEVFLTSWRAESAGKLKQRASNARNKRLDTDAPSAEEEEQTKHQSDTRRIAFVAGTTLGVIVAALGLRLLEMFVDPAMFETLPHLQQRLFRTTDVLMTGAVLGGGSDALHQLVLVFTNFFQSAAGRAQGVAVAKEAR